MKFKIIAVIAVILVMLLATAAYLATRDSGAPEGEPQQTEVQQ